MLVQARSSGFSDLLLTQAAAVGKAGPLQKIHLDCDRVHGNVSGIALMAASCTVASLKLCPQDMVHEEASRIACMPGRPSVQDLQGGHQVAQTSASIGIQAWACDSDMCCCPQLRCVALQGPVCGN